MKGVIFDIERFAVNDGPGIRTTVFMKGCPLRCRWCHNPEGLNPGLSSVSKEVRVGDRTFEKREAVGYEATVDEVMAELGKERIFMDESGGGVTFSGGEPLDQPEFLLEMLKACRAEGMHTAVDTSGYAPWERLQDIIPYTDLFLYDIKMADEQEHRIYTGVSNRPVTDNLRRLSTEGCAIQVRIPVIPGITGTEKNMDGIIGFLLSLPKQVKGVSLLPYHNTAAHKYERFGICYEMGNLVSMGREELEPLKEKFEKAGFVAEIGG